MSARSTSSAGLLKSPLPALVEHATKFRLSACQKALFAIGTGTRVQDIRDAEIRSAAAHALGYTHGPERPPQIMFINAGARGGKTLAAAYLATHRALVCDLSMIAPGEEVRVAYLSASKRQARALLGYSLGLIIALGLEKIIQTRRRDSFSILRGGHTIEFAVVKNSPDTLAGFWFPSAVVAEASVAVDPSAGGTPMDLDAIERTLRPRLLPSRNGSLGGILILESTSRDAAGPAYERASTHFAKPTAPIVVFKASTLELRPDDAALREHIERERAVDPINAEQQFDAAWVTAGSAGYLFGLDLIGASAVAEMPLNLPPEPAWESWAGVDLGFVSDGSSVAIVRKRPTGAFELASLRRWRPKKNTPLAPSVVVGEILDELQRHGTAMVWADVHHYAALVEAAQGRKGIRVIQAPANAQGKERTHRDAQELFASGCFRFARDAMLIRSLQKITASRTPDGALRIRSPRRRGDHSDDAAALVLAMHAAQRNGGPRSADPPFIPGAPSEYQLALGLVDAQGRPTTNSAATEFRVGPDARVHATPAGRQNEWATGSGSSFSKQQGF